MMRLVRLLVISLLSARTPVWALFFCPFALVLAGLHRVPRSARELAPSFVIPNQMRCISVWILAIAAIGKIALIDP